MGVVGRGFLTGRGRAWGLEVALAVWRFQWNIEVVQVGAGLWEWVG